MIVNLPILSACYVPGFHLSEMLTIIITILPMRKPRIRKANRLAQAHATKYGKPGLKPHFAFKPRCCSLPGSGKYISMMLSMMSSALK